MRLFAPFCIVAVFCSIILTGCFKPAQPPRAMIAFDYTPQNEESAGSADVTFAVVGAQLLTPNQPGMMQLVHQTPVPLFDDFIDNMTKDFMELLSALGYGVRGPFQSYDDMIHPEKEGSDLILTAEVDLKLDGSGVEYRIQGGYKYENSPLRPVGPVKIQSHVKLIVYESLTNTKMWVKNIAIEPVTVQLTSHNLYSRSELARYAAQYGVVGQHESRIPVTEYLQHENKFYSDVGHALQNRYTDILKGIYDYLDPREMKMVKNQSLELRKKKVY